MHPALINAALKMQGITQAEIARQFGKLSSAAVYQVINGRSRSKRIENRISVLTRIPLAELWPQWYGATRGKNRVSVKDAANAVRAAAVAN